MRCLSRRGLIATLFCFVLTASHAVPAGAAEDGFFNLSIVAVNCLQTPTAYPFQGGDCVPANGAVIVVTTPDGALIGTCIAEEEMPDSVTASCSVPVPYGAEVVVTEDPATIASGFAPTNNPQTFEVPISLPDGPVGGPVFINLPTASGPPASDQATVDAPEMALVGEPDWWIVPRAPGWGNTEEGDLYFGALVNNPTDTIVEVGVSWRAYESDGTPFPGCQMPGGDGPGVTTTVAPGETAYLRCSRTRVPNALVGLQVTSQLWVGNSLQTQPMNIEAIESELVVLADQSSPMETTYDVTALIQAPEGTDVETTLLFRFYTADGIQVGTCESDRLVIESEVNQRTHCAVPLLLDTHGPQPVTVAPEPVPG